MNTSPNLEELLKGKVSEEMFKRELFQINTKLNNADAYRIMEYRCEECKKSEFIWNSRNDVSPFGVRCRSCSGSAHHVNFSKDQFRPDFIPSKGRRYFADYTRERAEEAAKARLIVFADYYQQLEGALDNKYIEGTPEYTEHFLQLVTEIMQGGCSMDLLVAE